MSSPNSEGALRVVNPGLGGSIQDPGRPGWRRFGVPPSGWMDDHAAALANELLCNPKGAPVLELMLQGAELLVLEDVWLAVTGADSGAGIETWKAVQGNEGEWIRFPQNRSGVWTYLAVEGGFQSEKYFGSASAYSPAGMGAPLAADQILHRAPGDRFELPAGVSGRFAAPDQARDYDAPPFIHVWPGPQWFQFPESDRSAFITQPWTVTSQSNRTGYRLSGQPLSSNPGLVASEPVRVGTIQIPENGLPIVTMRDGPTVGGYPKLGWIDPADLSWMAQCRPGQTIRFSTAQ